MSITSGIPPENILQCKLCPVNHWNPNRSRKRAKTSFKNCKANCQTVQRLPNSSETPDKPIEPIENKIKQLLKRPNELQFQMFWSQYPSARSRQTSPHTDEFPTRSFEIYFKFQDFKLTSWKFHHLNLVNPFARVYQILSGIPPEDTIQIISSKPLESN